MSSLLLTTLDTGNTAWMIMATILVLLMSIPGIALFYGGLVRQKNILSILMQTVFIVAVVSLMHLANPVYANPLAVIFSGGLMLGAIFMATDYVTSPMTHKGMLIYGVCIGLLTVIIRNWGSYPEGMSFAILIMNAFTPLINTYVKPKRFGEKPAKK